MLKIFVFATEVTFSDHNPLIYLRECAPAKSAKLTRWSPGLQEFMHADSNIFHTSADFDAVGWAAGRASGL